ncbi:Uncharacterised protein [BD1-7 clade bacterium]|uniref:Serine aminopeptidase S33 domain-containing protein n=1 Tax=BD1-7 clade bacterium TaxID=2029982 RepID=A0A5S9QJ89_9GAMM|nr:Uncharacterised protein [BD1-7 clade bacterium]
MSVSEHTVLTPAGHHIAVRTYEPNSAPKAVVVIAGAIGVAQSHYADFAGWLAEQGYAAITFDYEGIGDSIADHVRYSKSDILSWANHDCPALLGFARDLAPGVPLNWVGHSVGGHMLGMMKDTRGIDKAITVASGSGYWRENSPPTKRVVWALWYLLVPVVVPVFGYFPGDKIKIISDLPKGVIWQWRKWCLNSDYAVGVESGMQQRFDEANFPITGFSFSDDEMMSQTNVDRLHGYFRGTDPKMVRVLPADIDATRIGHIGWHKSRHQAFWERFIHPEIVVTNPV